jgi:hypothetical protein
MPRSSEPKSASERAANTDRWTEILFRALSSRVAQRWRFVSFRGAGGGEWRGIVDVLAIRKDTSKSDHHLLKSGDLFDIVLVQMKGGSSRPPTEPDIHRLRAVARRYRAKDIVLFSWARGEGCTFERLGARNQWLNSSASELFG